jgi:hypothetical protein
MSKGPGRVQRAIIAAFEADHGGAFTLTELCQRAYPGQHVETRHRLAVKRAADGLMPHAYEKSDHVTIVPTCMARGADRQGRSETVYHATDGEDRHGSYRPYGVMTDAIVAFKIKRTLAKPTKS